MHSLCFSIKLKIILIFFPPYIIDFVNGRTGLPKIGKYITFSLLCFKNNFNAIVRDVYFFFVKYKFCIKILRGSTKGGNFIKSEVKPTSIFLPSMITCP